jgi:hypothetical protein
MRAVFIKAGEQPNTPDTNHRNNGGSWRARFCTGLARSITLGRTSLVPVQAKSLRSHAFDLVIKGVHLLCAPRLPGFRRIGAPQFFQRFLDGEFWGFGHGKPHIQAKRRP